MADLHEMMGKFIEDTVNRIVNERIASLDAETDRRAKAANDAMQQSCNNIQLRIHQMVEQGLRSLTTEGERIIERTCQRMVETSQNAMDDLPLTIQDNVMAMAREAEVLFQRRSQEWITQLQAESAEDVRKRMMADLADSAKSICDRNLFDFRSEFENHVNRCFQGVADRLQQPMPTISTLRQ